MVGINKSTHIKRILIIGIPLIIIIAISAFIIYTHDVHFVYDNQTCHVSNDGPMSAEDIEKLNSLGYVVNYPSFRNVASYNRAVMHDNVYPYINYIMNSYSIEIASLYSNHAKLDYTVEVKKNKTLTVKFFGYGYPSGKDEVRLEKEFIFDIKDIGIFGSDKEVRLIDSEEYYEIYGNGLYAAVSLVE